MTTIARTRPRNRLTGFTLVELAIVLLIVTLLLGGLLPTISSQIEQRHVADTRRQLDEIQQALVGFAVVNGRLPCPAPANVASGQPGAGVEAPTCTSPTSAGGVLPWVTLGISETDAWGRRFTYRVSPAFATSGVPFKLGTAGTLNVGLTPGATNVASAVPAVVVSHGANGLGAYTPAGTQLPGAINDELENANNDDNFVSHDPTPTFDDLVVWISPNTLMNRMVTAGKLP